jgi:hypothetical protein
MNQRTQLTILTAFQFVAAITSLLALAGRRRIKFTGTQLHSAFERAFEVLVAGEAEMNVTPNFAFCLDPHHGDSLALREALQLAADRGLLASDEGASGGLAVSLDIRIDEERARRYLDRSPLPHAFLAEVVRAAFPIP